MRLFLVARRRKGQDRSGVRNCALRQIGRPIYVSQMVSGSMFEMRAVWTQTGLLSQPVGEDSESVRMIWTGGHQPYIWFIWAGRPQPDRHWRVLVLLLAHCGPWQPSQILHGDRQRHEHIWTTSLWRCIQQSQSIRSEPCEVFEESPHFETQGGLLIMCFQIFASDREDRGSSSGGS